MYNPKTSPTPLQQFLRWAALLLWIGHLVWLAVVWNRLPSLLPTHYGFSGQPDAWGPRSSLLILPIIGTLLYGILALVGAFPSLWNTPSPRDPAHAQRVYSMTRTLLLWHTLVLNATFFYITLCSALCRPLGAFFLPIILLALFAGAGYYLWSVR